MRFDELKAKVEKIFLKAGLSLDAAKAVAAIIAAGERDGCKSHGIYRIEGCLRVVAARHVVPDAVPVLTDAGGPVIEIDACGGFSPVAFETSKTKLLQRAQDHGLAALVIRNCLHFSALWPEVEWLAEKGLASISMCPSYAAVAPAGGTAPLLGTNPFAFGWPRADTHPYVFDFATSVAARGEIEMKRQAGEVLPEGWAIDQEGLPTIDPQAALDGAMLPFGGHKGSALSTMIELLAGAMLGEFMSYEALDQTGTTALLPRHGALIIAFSPNTFAKNSGRDPLAEGERLLTAIGEQGARLPSQRRFAARANALKNGILLTETEWRQLDTFEAMGLHALDP